MMAKLTNTESRRLYSWWWDSHISPKNSKWLQENLTDMDTKVKTMIKLIEEDADSFARRAEMYYKKRPELMKLVEEFYRAYRALAERYDHATGALRQAQRTMAEAFPNQILPMLSDEPPSPSTESASHSRTIFDADDSLKPHNNRMNRPYSEEHDASPSKTGLKQVNGKFGNEEKPPHAKFSEGRSMRGLNFQHEGNSSSLVSAENTEAKVQSLKETISKSESEKAALLQHRISLEKISNMETEIFRCQQDLKKLDDEMLMAASNLKISEERYLLLEKTNQSLRSELDALKQRAQEQSEELKNKQEEARLLALDVENGVVKLKDMELSKMGVEEEIHHLKEENGSLNEQILSSALKIISLQDEIIILKDSIAKFEYEVVLHEEEKRALQQEISNTKKDKVELEQRHHLLTEQIGTITRNLESLQAMVEELRNRNTELKEICKKHEEEKNVHLESLKLMERISEKNLVLENSLSDANAEIEGSREKIKMLEYSFGSLNGMISVHLSEKVLLVSQVEFITKEMEKLSKNSALLENSLSDVNAELDSLRVNSKDLEESCQSLFAQNCTLLSEKDTLVSQVERAIRNLETLETRYSVLEHKYLSLENEKELALDEIMELEDSFKREKGEYETLIMSIMLSSNSQVSSFENKIHVLQEKAQLREKELDAEQQNIVNVEIENFIFQRCLHDINEKNSVLSIACQRHLQALKCTEKLISELRQELVVHGNKLASSLELNEKLRKGIVLMSRELNIVNKDFSSLDGVEDESILEPVLHEIRELVNSILHTRNESQHLHLENSIIMTILTQCGLQAIELRNEKDALERESEIKTKGLSVLQSKELELLELNGKLKMELQGGNQRQEVLKAEMAVLNAKLTDSQDANCTLEAKIRNILEEKCSLSKLFYDLKERNVTLEEENSVVLADLMTMECLYLIFKDSNEEKASELQFSRSHLSRLQEDKNELYQEIEQTIEKLVAAEVENIHLKETVVSLQGCSMILKNDLNTIRNVFEQSKLEIESSKYVLAQKDRELLQTDQKLQSMQEGNTLLHTRLEGLQLDLDNIMEVREELENKIIILLEGNAERDYEITGLRQDNEMMGKELNQLRKEVEDLKTKEGQLNYEIKNQFDEVKSCEVEIATLLNDAHIAKVNATIFEEKALELLMTCEISTMVQREALHEEITLRNADINQLKEKLASMEGETGGLKEELNAYMLPITALSDDIASLEEHTLLLAKHHTPNHPEKHENLMMCHRHSSSSQEPSDNHTAIAMTRHVELLKLCDKVKILEKLLVDTGNLIEQERLESNANLEAAMKEIEALKSEVNSTESKDITQVNYEQMMKDIQLDRCCNNDGLDEPGSISNARTDDQMSGSWETTERDLSCPIQKGSPVTTVHEIEYHPFLIESTTEKEVGIDKLQLSQRSAESHQEWNKRVIERLSSDAERLSLLQAAVEELKRIMETSEMNRSPKSFEFDRVKAQLKESEGVVSQLIGTNRDLVSKAEELLNASSDSRVLGASEMQRGSMRTVSEKARRGSETIGLLELDLQKIEYILLKLKEELENNRRIAAGRRRVLLQDYLYGRMDGKRQKKRRSCCLRPKTKDD